METFETNSAEETCQLGHRLADRFTVGDCIALTGPLGAGKTVLIRGIAVGLGVDDERIVSSPTFVLIQEYAGRVPIYHVDLYRMAAPDAELSELGLEEMLSDGIVLIEWADRVTRALPRPRWQIDILPTAPEARRFSLRRVD